MEVLKLCVALPFYTLAWLSGGLAGLLVFGARDGWRAARTLSEDR